ncbi:MAG: DUF2914 domain-containing protein [Acidobacteriia bacterium]|nr:DUF2914 domain-containing protein [Terriglobia bacterium]
MKRTLLSLAVLFLIPYLMDASVRVKPGQATGIQIVGAKLGKDVKDREITDETTEFSVNDKVYLWLKVTGAAGESLKATWKSGDHTYTSELAIGGSPWRTWWYMTAYLAGDWTITIADSKGNTLKEMSFKVK